MNRSSKARALEMKDKNHPAHGPNAFLAPDKAIRRRLSTHPNSARAQAARARGVKPL